MANDIYFGRGQKQTPAEPQRPGDAPRAPARPPVTRDPQPAADPAWSRQPPAQDGMAEQMRAIGSRARTETYGAQTGGSGSRSGGTRTGGVNTARAAGYSEKAFRAPSRSAAEEQLITEQIDSELLHRAPTQIPFNYIDTEDGYAAGERNRKPVSEKKQQKLKSKKVRKAQKSAKKAQKKKHRSGFRRFVKVVLCLLLILALLVGGATAFVATGYRPQKLRANAYVNEASLLSHPAVYNLLLMGIDMQATSGTSRSDSMILLSVDNLHMKVKMTSFMRDSYVYIPEYGEAKLNAACTYGGPQLVCDTIEYNFGVKIDGYVKVGYEILMDLVDGLGGITIPEVDSVEAAALAAEGYDAPIGTNIKMNGLQALHYCRIRKGQTDFYRTERQREVLNIIIKKALRTNPVTLALLGRKLLSKTECSVSQAELFALVFRTLPCLLGGTASERVPQDGTWYDDTRDGQAVLVVNFEENTAFLKEYIYEK